LGRGCRPNATEELLKLEQVRERLHEFDFDTKPEKKRM
jgi:hypothetical protein